MTNNKYTIQNDHEGVRLQREGETLWKVLRELDPAELFPTLKRKQNEGYIIDRAVMVRWYNEETDTDHVTISISARAKLGGEEGNGYFRLPNMDAEVTAIYPEDRDMFEEASCDQFLDGIISLPWESAVDTFNPLGDGPHRICEEIGILYGLVENLVNYHGHEVFMDPTEKPEDVFGDGVICDLLLEALRAQPKPGKEVRVCIEKIDQLVGRIRSSEKRDDAQDPLRRVKLYQYLTRNYFYHRHQTTAMEYHRTRKGIRLEKLSAMTGVSVRQLRNYEDAQTAMLAKAKPYILKALTDALEVPEEELLFNGKPVMRYPR